jgi:perosamine synthetase
MVTTLAVLGGDPVLRPEELPRRWPYWSQQPAMDLSGPFRAWPSPAVDELEQVLAEEHQVRHALFTHSGTAALWAAYFGLGLSPGDEVLVPANTFLATVTPLYQLNLVPVLCDADPETGCLDLDDADGRLTGRTKAVAVTHVWGTPLDLEALYLWAAARGLAVVEDCSHAHGTRSNGRPVGSGATVAAMSLGAAKTVSGGVAGALLTSSQSVYERTLLLGMPLARARREVSSPELDGLASTGFGANLRGHPLAATLALEHLSRLEDILQSKNANIHQLEALISEATPLMPPSRPSWWTRGTRYGFKARVAGDEPLSAATLVAALRAEGLPVSGSPGPLLHRHRLFRDATAITTYAPGRAPGDIAVDPDSFPRCDELVRDTVSFDARLLHGDATRLLEATAQALEKLDAGHDALLTWQEAREQ